MLSLDPEERLYSDEQHLIRFNIKQISQSNIILQKYSWSLLNNFNVCFTTVHWVLGIGVESRGSGVGVWEGMDNWGGKLEDKIIFLSKIPLKMISSTKKNKFQQKWEFFAKRPLKKYWNLKIIF